MYLNWFKFQFTNIIYSFTLDLWPQRLQFWYWRQSHSFLSIDARVNGPNEQISHVLLATKTGQRRYLGRYKSQSSAGLRKHQGIQFNHTCWGKFGQKK